MQVLKWALVQISFNNSRRTILVRPVRFSKEEDEKLLPEFQQICGQKGTYGYRRDSVMINRERRNLGLPQVNHKRIYRIMKTHSLLLQRHTGRPTRTHDGQVITRQSNMRWYSDTLSLKCWNGEKVEIAFALDTCDREVMSWIATSLAITGEMIRNLIAESVEKRFGSVLKLPKPVQWLSDNGGPYIAYDTRVFAESIGFIVCNTPA